MTIAQGASVAHLQHVLESMARLVPVAGPPLMPWLLGNLPPGSTAVVVGSEMSSDMPRVLSQLQRAGFSTLPVLGVSHAQRLSARPDTLFLTPGCDVAAIIEGHA
jgi:hypothetical protein